MAETLGTLRLKLVKTPAGSGCDPEVLTGHINDAIEEICRSRPWTRLNKDQNFTIQTPAQYVTGTVSITAGATAGTGAGTTFTPQMTGQWIRINNTVPYYVFTYVGAGAFTIDRPYEDTVDAVAAAFTIWQAIYPLPTDLSEIKSIRNEFLQQPVEYVSREYLNRTAPARQLYGSPKWYTLSGDTAGGVPQVELYPGPDRVQGLPIVYRAKQPFLVNSSDAIPDWFNVGAIRHLVLSELYGLADDQNRAAAEYNKYRQFLASMANEDARRMAPQQLQMSDRFIRHRALRATRLGRAALRNWNGTEGP